MQNERFNHTLSPTALVNEAYLRFYPVADKDTIEHQFFLASAARDMRQVLVDHARAKKADKRGKGVSAITLDEDLNAGPEISIDILALNTALEKLELVDVSKVRIVEMRYFAGMTLEEIAAELEISVATVKRKWSSTRAWLFRELSQ